MAVPSTYKGVTSYDWLKTLAVILMIVDHVGYYFDHGNDWLRVFGRMSAPIWFFLVGYARTRALEPRLWIGLAIMEAGRFAAGMPLLPINILASFLLIRWLVDPIMDRAAEDNDYFWKINAVCLIAALPSLFILEYGTGGVLFAMAGWMARNAPGQSQIRMQMLFAALGYILWQSVGFHFDRAQILVLGAGIAVLACALLLFRPVARSGVPAPVRVLAQFCGRRSLDIYIAHLLAFQTVASLIDPVRFPAFHLVFLGR